VFELLPRTLARIAATYDAPHERDTFLTAALPVAAGAMPFARLFYGKWLSLNLNAAVVAPTGSGKGRMEDARRIGEALDRELYERSREGVEAWEAAHKARQRGADEGDLGPRPNIRTLFTPGDTSATGLKETLAVNPHCVMFETEFRTVSTVLGQEWGQGMRDVLLKSFHNEQTSYKRAGGDPNLIPRPALGTAISGTPETFAEVISDLEDGLFSRFCFYSFKDSSGWRSQFFAEAHEERGDAIAEAAALLREIHEALDARRLEPDAEPLYVRFGPEQARAVDRACGGLFEAFREGGGSAEIESSIKRAAVVAVRIAAVLCIIRLSEAGASLRTARSVQPSGADVEAGIRLAFLYLSHAFRMAERLAMRSRGPSLREDQRAFVEALPVGEFTTADAYEAAASAPAVAKGRPASDDSLRRWVRKWLGKFSGKDYALITDLEHGLWERPSPTGAGAFLSFPSFLSFLLDGEAGGADAYRAASAETSDTNQEAPF
jgi:hypothetical protein